MSATDPPPGSRAAAIKPIVERELGEYIDYWQADATTLRVEGSTASPAPPDIKQRVRAGVSAIEMASDVEVRVAFGADFFEVKIESQTTSLSL